MFSDFLSLSAIVAGVWTQVDPCEPRWTKVDPGGPKWTQVDPSGPKWTHLGTSGHKWIQVEPRAVGA